MKLYFSDFFEVSATDLDTHGAFNVSLITDLPLFVDPFLLFNSRKKRYRALHDEIIRYLAFLRDKSASQHITPGLIQAWYSFPEIPQTWLGFTRRGNRGSGLGRSFAHSLNANLADVFRNFGKEQITKGSHLEKLCLIADGVGNDTISDFTTNLIHGYLLEYTQDFARKRIRPELRRTINLARVRFNYDTEVWEPGTFDLPFIDGDHVLLTPKDMLTKDDTWINRGDLVRDFDQIPEALPNAALRAQVNNYFRKRLPLVPKGKEPTQEDTKKAIVATLIQFPELIDAFIRRKEDNGDRAESLSDEKVQRSIALFVQQYGSLVQQLESDGRFFALGDTYDEAYQRVLFLKDVIENKGGHRVFYVKGRPVEREEDLQVLYRLTWFRSRPDVTREANDGRGPVDFKVSLGSADKALVELKLARNTKLKQNLAKQTGVYEKASDASRSIKGILYFTKEQLDRVRKILAELGMENDPSVIVIDARADNKPSGSNAK